MRMTRAALAATVLAVVLVTLVSPARAQLQIGGSQSNFGRASLSPGFVPDPHNVAITSGGNIDARAMRLGRRCVGSVTRQPDFILDLTGRSRRLRFFFDAQGNGDTSLIINDSRSRWRCNDDSRRSVNPEVTIRNARAGQYDVWVGSYSAGQSIQGTLSITELDLHPGAAVASVAAPAATGSQLATGGSSSNFGRRSLRAGFTPDPATLAVTSGGSLDVSRMGLGSGCVGFATAQPDVILNWSGGGSLLRLYFAGSGDTALVINDARGRWYCNDDSNGGTNPMVDIPNPGAGQYDIWVTSYRAGESIRGTLHATELRGNHP